MGRAAEERWNGENSGGEMRRTRGRRQGWNKAKAKQHEEVFIGGKEKPGTQEGGRGRLYKDTQRKGGTNQHRWEWDTKWVSMRERDGVSDGGGAEWERGWKRPPASGRFPLCAAKLPTSSPQLCHFSFVNPSFFSPSYPSVLSFTQIGQLLKWPL